MNEILWHAVRKVNLPYSEKFLEKSFLRFDKLKSAAIIFQVIYIDSHIQRRTMEPREYYKTVLEKLKKCFEHSGCAIAIEQELINEGYSKDFPKMITSKENIDYLTVERGFQIHLPIVGQDCQTVLCPMDFEIFLGEEQCQLYSDKETQKLLFKQTVPVIDYIKKIFVDRKVPFLLDYTPSGGHLLFNVDVDSNAGKALQSIGVVEQGMLEAGHRQIERRKNGV